LIEAVERFDPDRGVRFSTFASYRIRGRVLNALGVAYDMTGNHIEAQKHYQSGLSIAPDNPFNPINSLDPGNPANPINRLNPNNPFNPINELNPNNPLNPINRLNPNTPFAPLNRPPGTAR